METQTQKPKNNLLLNTLNEYFSVEKMTYAIDCSKTIKEELTVLDSVQSLKGDVFL
jgi:hypothetical protein